MKKDIILLLMVQAIVFAQNQQNLKKVRITNNITSTTVPFVAVIESNGKLVQNRFNRCIFCNTVITNLMGVT
jgi:uncharacterized protein with PIN domain